MTMNFSRVICTQNPKHLNRYFNRTIIRHFSDVTETLIDDISPSNEPLCAPVLEREISYAETKLTPLMDMKYADQLNLKERHACLFLNKLRIKFEDVSAPALRWASNIYPGLPCPLQSIIPSPQIYNYRSRIKYIIGQGYDGNTKRIGPTYTIENGVLHIDPFKFPEDRSTPHRRFVNSFQKYLDESPYDSLVDSKGVWRSVELLSNDQDEMMAMVHISPINISKAQEREIDQSLIDYFFKGPGSEIGLTSLYKKCYYHSKEARNSPNNLLFGKSMLTHKILGLQMASTPESIRPANIPAAEKLLEEIKRIVEPTARTTVIEVNQYKFGGGGLYSLALSDSVRACLCIGTDLHIDAEEIAFSNNIGNVTFLTGAPSKVIAQMGSKLSKLHDVMAVMDISRYNNLDYKKELHMLRTHPFIDRVLLVCNMHAQPNSVSDDKLVGQLSPLATRKEGEHMSTYPAMMPRYAFTVDTLPHTYDFKLGLLLQRTI